MQWHCSSSWYIHQFIHSNSTRLLVICDIWYDRVFLKWQFNWTYFTCEYLMLSTGDPPVSLLLLLAGRTACHHAKWRRWTTALCQLNNKCERFSKAFNWRLIANYYEAIEYGANWFLHVAYHSYARSLEGGNESNCVIKFFDRHWNAGTTEWTEWLQHNEAANWY